MQTQQWTAAQDLFAKAMRRNPRVYEYMAGFADLSFKLGQFQEAKTILQELCAATTQSRPAADLSSGSVDSKVGCTTSLLLRYEDIGDRRRCIKQLELLELKFAQSEAAESELLATLAEEEVQNKRTKQKRQQKRSRAKQKSAGTPHDAASKSAHAELHDADDEGVGVGNLFVEAEPATIPSSSSVASVAAAESQTNLQQFQSPPQHQPHLHPSALQHLYAVCQTAIAEFRGRF